jgi:hypothetical protein
MQIRAIYAAGKGHEGCPTCQAKIERRPFEEMYGGWHYLDGERVEIRQTPEPDFANPIVLDALTQYFGGKLYRIWPSERYYSCGGARLHRHVWQAAFGPIPKGCHIHHRDADRTNNQIENLECIPSREHNSISSQSLNDSRAEHFSEYARGRAAEWHRSPEGRLWHKRHAQRAQSWTKWHREKRNCIECGVEFEGLVRKSGNSQVYCTTACKAAAYRARGKSNEYAAAYRARQAAKRRQ